MSDYGIGLLMHVKIRNRIAVIEFETGKPMEKMEHMRIIKEMVKLIDDGFKKFIFDFSAVDISFNSTISGFLLAVVRKLRDDGAIVEIDGITGDDLAMLKLIGLNEGEIKYIIKEKTVDKIK